MIGLVSFDVMDSNIIEEYRSIPISERTKEDFDSLIRTLEIVWSHKVYQDGLIEHYQMENRELYDLSITMADGLVVQDQGSKTTLTKYKDSFKQQGDNVISTCIINQKHMVFTEKQLRQICMYYLNKESLYFIANSTIDVSSIREHMFTFGEVVVKDVLGEEVIVVNEDNDTIEYVTCDMLVVQDKYIVPKIGLKSLFKSKYPTKYFIVTKLQVDKLYNQYASIFDRLT